MKIILVLLMLILVSGCSMKRVMKDCEPTKIENYWFCSEQYKVWR
jgi:uncharacterized protein YceK